MDNSLNQFPVFFKGGLCGRLGTSRRLAGAVLVFFLFFSAGVNPFQPVRQAIAGPADELLTLELQGVNILDVLKLLSKRSGLNIVAGKNVQGQVSLFLQQVKVMDALMTILETSDLAYVEDRGIIKVLTKKDYEDLYGRPYRDTRATRQFDLIHAKADNLLPTLGQIKSTFGKILAEPRTNTLVITETPEVMREMEELIARADQPFESRVFKLQYAKAEEIGAKLQKIVQPGQGTLEVDLKSNRIFVHDSAEKVKRIGELVDAFDVRQQQVLIEAKVMEVNLDDNFRFGIDWDLVADKAGSLNTIVGAATFPVSAPAGAALSTLTIGSGNDDLQTVIQIIEQMGKTNTLSSPRLAVINNEEAKLSVATRQPFVSQTVVQSVNSSTTADQVQFVDVGVTLNVTPSISEENYIQMKVKPEISSAGTPVELEGVSNGSNTPFTRTIIPVVTTQELETVVMVKSGTTLVIGGLIQDVEDKTMVKLPILGNIPVVGKAFTSKTHNASKTELVVFLTPTILSPDDTSPELKRFFTPSGSLRTHDETGGYIYDKAHFHSQGPIRTDDKPYWEVEGWEVPDYLPLGIHSNPLDPHGKLTPDVEIDVSEEVL